MATTQEVFDRHVASFGERDVQKVLEDYTDESLAIVNGEVFEGLDGIATFFSQLFAELPADCQFDVTSCVVKGPWVYITWNAESDTVVYEFATDTFVVEDSKIVLQTIGAVKRSK